MVKTEVIPFVDPNLTLTPADVLLNGAAVRVGGEDLALKKLRAEAERIYNKFWTLPSYSRKLVCLIATGHDQLRQIARQTCESDLDSQHFAAHQRVLSDAGIAHDRALQEATETIQEVPAR